MNVKDARPIRWFRVNIIHFEPQYRIVADRVISGNYEVQIRNHWWEPFRQANGINTKGSLEDSRTWAANYIRERYKKKKGLVYEQGTQLELIQEVGVQNVNQTTTQRAPNYIITH